MSTQLEKALAFRALHERPGAFVIPNPWDAGSALLLSSLGFEALATTSAGFAFSIGRRDSEGSLSRAETLANARAIVEATDLPVSADLENGFGHDPEHCTETIRAASAIGLAGGSIEDASGDEAKPIYDLTLAVERVAAAVEAARSLPIPFVLTARAENFLHGRPDLDDTIRRLQAFEQAGAEVLYAPGLTSLEQIRTVCASVSRPVNVVMGLVGGTFTVQQLAEAGVKRISLGSSLARAALGALMRAAREIKGNGTFSFASEAMPFAEVHRHMRPKNA
ncbi:isocitrate lyase/PEP mutase family protein [Dongia deserti]|uniref:isocitrate lyase/PEP mutase family protein n=1 Tax=Dongia deserti TaxID=2268030 RepID=UPI000E649925|nr:isocitrate lyase/phosphoenolpyruvate mutase family protein [Dongia deserti]